MEAVYVLATSKPATVRALRRAGELARRAERPVVLLVPHATTFRPTAVSVDPAVALADEYRALTRHAGVDAQVRVCVCRRASDIFRQLVIDPVTIVIGGARRPLWPTPEQRLAARMTRAGHHVVFEDARNETPMLTMKNALLLLAVVFAASPARAQAPPDPPAQPPAADAQKADEKKSEPFAFADFTWLTGNPRTKVSPIDTPAFTGEFRVDTNYTYSFNHP